MRRRLLLTLLLAWPASTWSGQIAGTIYNDENRDGLIDPTEIPLDLDVRVVGRSDLTGAFDLTLPTVAGAFDFALDDGCYVVGVAPIDDVVGQPSDSCAAGWEGWPVGARRFTPTPQPLIARLAAGGTSILALGDSNALIGTNGAPAFCGDVTWLTHLADKIRCIDPVATLRNEGLAGQTTNNLLIDDGSNNVFLAASLAPDIVTVSMWGNDFRFALPGDETGPWSPVELANNADKLRAARRNMQEALLYLQTELPNASIIWTTYYNLGPTTCSPTVFKRVWMPIWTQVMREVAQGLPRPVSISLLFPDMAHTDLLGADCCGETGALCDLLHVNETGARVEEESHWEALGGVNLGPKDAMGSTAVTFNVPVLPVMMTGQFSDTTVVSGTVTGGADALVQDDIGALVEPDTEFVVFGIVPDVFAISLVKVWVRYRTVGAVGAVVDDYYRFDASVTGFAGGHDLTDWNDLTPILGAADDPLAAVLALPEVPDWRTVSAALTVNLEDDGRARGFYEFLQPTWSDLTQLEVRFRTTAVGTPDPFQVEIDAVWIEVHGGAPGQTSVFRSPVLVNLFDPGSLIASLVARSYDDTPPTDPLLFYATDIRDTLFLTRDGAGVQLSW